MRKYDEAKIRNRIYQYRKANGDLSLRKLSELMPNVPFTTYDKLESGRTATIKFKYLFEISNALGVSVDDLLVDCLEYYDNPDSDFSIDTEIETMIKSLCSKNEHIIALINLCNTIISSREKN